MIVLASIMPFILSFLRVVFAFAFTALLVAPAHSQTLQTVKDRGHLICGASEQLLGFAQQSSEGFWSGFDVDLCRAISAAIFGDPDKVEFISYDGLARFAPLQLGDVDVLVRNASWNLRRDSLYQVRYVGTSFFDGQSFLIRKNLGIVSSYELDELSICVIDASEEQSNLVEFSFKNQITYTEILYQDRHDLSLAYEGGLCDAISASSSHLYSMMRNMSEPDEHQILPERISKQPLGPVIKLGDDEWYNLINWVLFALVNGEELGVNSTGATSFDVSKNPAIRRLLGLDADFGKALGLEKEWAKNVISSVGNYKEIYERSFGSQTGLALPRGQNALWTNGGLLFAPPIR